MYLSAQKRKWLLVAALGFSGSFLTAGAFAQVGQGAVQQEQKVHHKWPQAALSAEASTEIAQDTVRITLATEISAASQAAVAKALSKTLDEVMAQAKGKSGVKVSSGNYHISPMNDKNGKISNWRGRAEIFLESTDFAAASELAGVLGDRMPIGNLTFSVSPQARAKQEAALLDQAAQAFRDRAQATTHAFGFDSYTVRDIELGGSGARFQPAARMMSMDAKQSSVPLEAGTEIVTVTVRGSIFLHSAKK